MIELLERFSLFYLSFFFFYRMSGRVGWLMDSNCLTVLIGSWQLLSVFFFFFFFYQPFFKMLVSLLSMKFVKVPQGCS